MAPEHYFRRQALSRVVRGEPPLLPNAQPSAVSANQHAPRRIALERENVTVGETAFILESDPDLVFKPEEPQLGANPKRPDRSLMQAARWGGGKQAGKMDA